MRLTHHKSLPLLLLMLVLGLFFYLRLDRYFSFHELKNYRISLLSWKQDHYVMSVVLFMTLYILSVAISFPGATFLTLIGGFLFGIVWGSILVLLSATIGSVCIFLAVKWAFESWASKRTAGWINKLRAGFQYNAFQYILVLRLIPLFPFWVINIAAALLGVRLSVFFIATFLGIMPGTIIYVMLGNGLGYFFDQNQTPNLRIIFEPQIFIPLFFLALLSLLPILYKLKKKKHHESLH